MRAPVVSRTIITISATLASFLIPASVSAATSPSLGSAASYAIIAQTYVNTVPGTTVNGDIGFVTAPAVTPAGAHTNFGGGSAFTTAVADRNTALAALSGEACTYTFPAGPVDLAADTSHGALGVYTPGVYCVNSMVAAVTLGAGGITLDGNGTYIFRFNGSLMTSPSSTVTLSNGASACDVFWVVNDNAVTSSLGENSVFAGSLFDTVRLTVQSNVTWTGRALIPDGFVTTAVDDTITTPSSCVPQVPPVVDDPIDEPDVPPPTVTATSTPEAPNTGAGGDAATLIAILSMSLLIGVSGAFALRRMR